MHTRLCILLVLAGCVYAATDDSNSTSSNDLTTTTQSSSTTTTAIPSTTSTTSATSTTSTPSTTSTTSTPSSTTSTTSTTSTPSTTSTTSTPSSTTSATSTTSSSATTSTTSSPSSTTSTTLRPPGPPRRGPPGSPRLPGHLAHPHPLPIPQVVTQGIKIADNIARQIFGNLVPPPPSGNRGGPNARHPRAAAFSISDPLKMMSLNGSLTVPSTFSDMLKFPMPNIDEMVPDIPQSSSNYSDIDIPKISSYESPVSRFVPGVQDALDQVHEMISNELQPGADMPEAIQTAMQDILASDNPTDGLRELCSMVMNAYRIVAEHCPLLIAQNCVLAEGLKCVQNMINILEYVTSQD